MPRDLSFESEKATVEGLPFLYRESDAARSTTTADPTPLYSPPSPYSLMDDSFRRLQELHPFALLLNQDDLDDCDWLEHLAFEPHEAASREKLAYRLSTCGELCSGLFTSGWATSPGPLGKIISSRNFPSIDSHDSDRKRVLLAHIIATKSCEPLATDVSMDFPQDWQSKYQLAPPTGHNEDGDTICLHSMAVHPELEKRGLGMTLLKGWTQRMRGSGEAKRIALITRERLVPWYEKAGFKKLGLSKAQYGGGGWFDMVMEFGEQPNRDDF